MKKITLKNASAFITTLFLAATMNAQTFVQDNLSYSVLSAADKTVAVKSNDIDLVNVVIPETVTNDGVTYTVTQTQERGFEKMKSLLTVDIPKTIVKFGKHTFNECSNLEKTIIHDINAWVQIDFNGTSLANPIYKSGNLYLGDSLLTEAVITAPIEQINPLTFYYCLTLKKVVLPPTVKTIGKWGFYRCGMEEISLPESLTTLEQYAFNYSGLKRLEMPANLVDFPTSMFNENLNLKYVKLPANMEVLPLNTFIRCNSLEEVVFNDRLKEIKKGAFVACAIKKLVFPDSLETINNQAFLDNIYLEEITFGPNMKFIGYLTFYVQEETVKQFNWKSPLKKITCLATVPPELQINTDKNGVEYNLAWNEEVYDNVTLYVPKGCGEAYRTAAEWKQFKNIVELENGGVSDVTGKSYSITASNGCINIVGEDNPYVEVYDIMGRKVYSGNTNMVTPANRGVYVVSSMGKTVKVVL